jgi:hypothetical protein
MPSIDRSEEQTSPRVPPRQREGDLVREAFRRRAERAIERLAASAGVEMLVEALAAPSDFGTIARALASVGDFGSALNLDPLAESLARGAAERERLATSAGGLLSASEIGRALGGISRQAVDKRRRANQLLGVRVAGDWRYPAAQLGPDGHVPPGLATVLSAMAGVAPWATLDFLLAADDVLGGLSPLDALHQGGAIADEVHRILDAREIDAFG